MKPHISSLAAKGDDDVAGMEGDKVQAKTSLTTCPKCGDEMTRIDKSTMTGNDMRTYRCDRCGEERVVDFGPALWKVLSDAREADVAGRTEEESLQLNAAVGQRQRYATNWDNKFYMRLGVIVTVGLVAMILLLSSLMR